MSADKDLKLTNNFTKAEMACQHCGLCLMGDGFMQKLQALRDAFGGPLTVTSGYRCRTHNTNVGGSPNSYHTKGRAADLQVPDKIEDAVRLMVLAQQIFPNAVQGPGFIHVDDGPKRKWSYT